MKMERSLPRKVHDELGYRLFQARQALQSVHYGIREAGTMVGASRLLHETDVALMGKMTVKDVVLGGLLIYGTARRFNLPYSVPGSEPREASSPTEYILSEERVASDSDIC